MSSLQRANDIADDFGLCLENIEGEDQWRSEPTTLPVAMALQKALASAGFSTMLATAGHSGAEVYVDLSDEHGEIAAGNDAETVSEMGR